jgi:hypothetical protein
MIISYTPATNNTAWSIICGAMWKACIIPEGDDPSSEEIAKYTRTLNQYINFVQTRGIRLWLQKDFGLELEEGKGLYTLGPNGNVRMVKPMQIEDQYYLYPKDMGATRRPVFKISRQEWDMLSVTTQRGPITQIFVDPQQYTLNINTWLIPDKVEAKGRLHVVLREQVENFVSITDGMNFPIEWALTLEWGLAQQICQGQPPAVMQRCDAMAALHLQALEEWDSEYGTSILPRPDQRMFQGSQRFRGGAGWR